MASPGRNQFYCDGRHESTANIWHIKKQSVTRNCPHKIFTDFMHKKGGPTISGTINNGDYFLPTKRERESETRIIKKIIGKGSDSTHREGDFKQTEGTCWR